MSGQLGAVLDDGLVSGDVASAALAEGLIVNAVAPGVIRLAPPLTVSSAEIAEAATILAGAIAATRGGS